MGDGFGWLVLGDRSWRPGRKGSNWSRLSISSIMPINGYPSMASASSNKQSTPSSTANATK